VTAATRRRLIVCFLAVVLTVPLETILLQAISTPDARRAVQEWVEGLSPQGLEAAANQIQGYPLAYRREIMRALPPSQRTAVWRRHLAAYRQAHPGLAPAVVSLIESASALITPQIFVAASSSDREELSRVADQLTAALGRGEAEFLLYRLGPPDGTFASLEPFSERLANWVRNRVVAFARSEDCDCSTDWGCGLGLRCKGGGCAIDDDWPMCGWLWTETCDGTCAMGMD
jgi:hypothetical protein